MLLYGIYTPSKHCNTWNRTRLYAFASTERMVMALHEVNGSGAGTLELVTQAEALRKSAVCSLYTGLNKDGIPKIQIGKPILVREDGVCDIWDGTIKEIKLAHAIADERIPCETQYP